MIFPKKTDKDKEAEAKKRAEEDAFFSRQGEKIARKLKLKERIEKINKYGTENPKRIFVWITGIVVFSFILGFIIPTPKYGGGEIKKEQQIAPIAPSNAEKVMQEEVHKLYNELETLYNDAQAILKKGNLTRQDSLDVVNKFVRMDEIDKILNTKYNKNDSIK